MNVLRRACLDSWKWEDNGKWENSFPTSLVCFELKMGNEKTFLISFLHLFFTLPFPHFQGATVNSVVM